MAMFVVLSKISLFLIFKFHLETRTCLFLQLKTDILEKIFQDIQDILIARAVARLHQIVTPTCWLSGLAPQNVWQD